MTFLPFAIAVLAGLLLGGVVGSCLWRWLPTVLLLVAVPVEAQAPPAKVEILPTEIDAVGWALSALTAADEAGQPLYSDRDRLYIRFVWVPPWGDAEWHGVLNWAVNMAASHARSLVRADVHANGWLLAYNLERLAPDPLELKRLVATWDELAVRDPIFHVPEINQEKAKIKAAILAPHLQEALARHVSDAAKSQRLDVLVTQLTGSTGAIYRADFLLEQLLTSVRGKYPEFIQIDFQVKEFTPLQAFLKKNGFFLEQSREGWGDKSAYLTASDVTGKDRIITAITGLFSTQPAVGTFDKKDLRTKSAQAFARNLLEFDPFFDAAEWFIPGKNGLPRRVLSDAKGNIQRVAPPDIVADHTKPAGFTHELEMGMSCEMCHSPDGGYKLQRNDLEAMLGSDFDFFGDVNAVTYTSRLTNKLVTLTKAQAVDRLVARFGESIYDPADSILARAERDYVRAVASLTDYPVKADGPNAVQLVGAKLKTIYHNYRFRTVNADRACLELGVRVPEGQGLAYLRKLVPAPPAGEVEDILIGLLRAGIPIKRDDMDSIHVEMARRAITTRPTLAGEGKKNASVDYHRFGAYAVAG